MKRRVEDDPTKGDRQAVAFVVDDKGVPVPGARNERDGTRAALGRRQREQVRCMKHARDVYAELVGLKTFQNEAEASVVRTGVALLFDQWTGSLERLAKISGASNAAKIQEARVMLDEFKALPVAEQTPDKALTLFGQALEAVRSTQSPKERHAIRARVYASSARQKRAGGTDESQEATTQQAGASKEEERSITAETSMASVPSNSLWERQQEAFAMEAARQEALVRAANPTGAKQGAGHSERFDAASEVVHVSPESLVSSGEAGEVVVPDASVEGSSDAERLLLEVARAEIRDLAHRLPRMRATSRVPDGEVFLNKSVEVKEGDRVVDRVPSKETRTVPGMTIDALAHSAPYHGEQDAVVVALNGLRMAVADGYGSGLMSERVSEAVARHLCEGAEPTQQGRVLEAYLETMEWYVREEIDDKDGATFAGVDIVSTDHGVAAQIVRAGDVKVVVRDKAGTVVFETVDQSWAEQEIRADRATRQDVLMDKVARNTVTNGLSVNGVALGPEDLESVVADRARPAYERIAELCAQGLSEEDAEELRQEVRDAYTFRGHRGGVDQVLVPLQDGDVVYAYTDGIGDNLTPQELVRVDTGGVDVIDDVVSARVRGRRDTAFMDEEVRIRTGAYPDGFVSAPKQDDRGLVRLQIQDVAALRAYVLLQTGDGESSPEEKETGDGEKENVDDDDEDGDGEIKEEEEKEEGEDEDILPPIPIPGAPVASPEGDEHRTPTPEDAPDASKDGAVGAALAVAGAAAAVMGGAAALDALTDDEDEDVAEKEKALKGKATGLSSVGGHGASVGAGEGGSAPFLGKLPPESFADISERFSMDALKLGAGIAAWKATKATLNLAGKILFDLPDTILKWVQDLVHGASFSWMPFKGKDGDRDPLTEMPKEKK